MAPKSSSQQPAEPIRLSTNCIVDGIFIRAGDPTPYVREEDLPENLRPLVATGDEEPPYHPSERNIYFGSAGARGRARRVLSNVQWQETLEAAALAEQVLPAEAEEALQAEHDLRIGKAKAQAEFNRAAADAAYEAASKQAAETVTQYFVRRGGEFARVERARLKPGEATFVKRPNGEYEASGFVNAEGEPPDPEIYP